MTDEEMLELIKRQMELENRIQALMYAQDSPEIRLLLMRTEQELYEVRRKINDGL